MKKRGLFLISIVFLLTFSLVSIYAQDEPASIEEEQADVLTGLEEEFADAELKHSAGITPDSAFYFVEDKILSNFRDDSSNREKKVAELLEMVGEGNIEAARESLQRYQEYASNLEEEIDPDSATDVKRSAAAISSTLREIESQIPEGQRGEFVDGVLDQEASIVTAGEIASKIMKLCEELSSLDPSTYASTCKTSADSPKWQQSLDRKLTKEQEKEARQFFEVMSSCFENPSGCQCDKIQVESFADECSIIAPLVAKCEGGDESACDEMDARGDPIDLLPDYLQSVMRGLEDKYREAEFDNHAPKECREAGTTDRESCTEIMFKLNAPEECVAALDRGEIVLSNEREARKACEKIMFEANAPDECIDAGITDFKECGKLMFEQSAPEECIAAGLTGESQGDHRKCEQIMKSSSGEGREGRGRGPSVNFNCRNIQDSNERLACFDKAVEGAQEHFENRGPSGGWPEPCEKAGATTRESCEQVMREFGENRRNEGDFNRESFGSESSDFRQPPCSTPEECEQFREQNPDFSPPEGFEGVPPPPGTTPEEFRESPPEEQAPSSSDSSGSSSTDGNGGSITGNIIRNNRFMQYYFRY